MSGQQPPRRGHGAPSRHPTRVDTTGRGPATTPRTAPSRSVKKPAPPQVLLVKQLESFFTSLPPWGISQFARDYTRVWDPSTLVQGATVLLNGTDVEAGMAWIITDVEFYLIAPTSTWGGTKRVAAGEVADLVRFNLQVGTGAPMVIEGTSRASVGGTPMTDYGMKTGWPDPDEKLGPRTVPGSAIYALEGQKIKTTITVQAVPVWRVMAYGVTIRGVQVGTEILEKIWR